MSSSEWKLPKTRTIYVLPEEMDRRECLEKMRQSGIQTMRYLQHLGMIVGDRQVSTIPHVLYTERDIRITITEPMIEPQVTSENNQMAWGIERIGAPNVWRMSRGKGVRVAVVDTGISSQHPAIWPNYKGGINILSPQSPPEDFNGHGTHVAGIIAGRGEKVNLLGAAPRASLYAVKAFDRRGVANLSDLLASIDWCIGNRMDIINMSFGMSNVSELLRYAIQKAHRKGIIMVAATGNRGQKDKIDFPARYDETIAVGSVSENGVISRFSNMGKGIDIIAPGEKIPSAWLNGTTRVMSGTSMAVPHVTGTIALLLQLNGSLNPEYTRYTLLQSASSFANIAGLGCVNAYRAVQMLNRVRS